MIGWILSLLSIFGALFNAYKRIEGFYFWIIANIGWIILNIQMGFYEQIPMWIIFTIISFLGILHWRKEENNV